MSDNIQPYEEFFETNGDRYIEANIYDVTRHFTVEELYQSFKNRLIAEMNNEKP